MQAVTTTADWSIWINFIEACYIDVGDVINDDWHFVLSPTFFFRTPMHRLNSGIRNRHNFFLWPIYLFQKVVTDSVNHADSGDIKVQKNPGIQPTYAKAKKWIFDVQFQENGFDFVTISNDFWSSTITDEFYFRGLNIKGINAAFFYLESAILKPSKLKLVSAIHIQVSFTEFKNPNNPGIQPNHRHDPNWPQKIKWKMSLLI